VGYKHFLVLVGVLVLAGGLFVWQFSRNATTGSNKPDIAEVPEAVEGTPTESSKFDESISPFAAATPSTPAGFEKGTTDANSANLNNTVVNQASQPVDASFGPSIRSVDVSSLGYAPLSDERFLELADQLRSDPALLQQLIDEFRQEADPTRKEALSRLLGEAGGSEVTLTASELIYSGDPESRRIGLELLQQIQPDSAEARDITSTLLATEVDPDVLINTLTTLAKPGEVEDDSREILTDQVAFLTSHEDASVRSISLNILSRWSQDGHHTEILRSGLSDSEAVVRESAAYSLVGYDSVDQTLIDSLMGVAINANEETRARRGAILALKGMTISDIERQQVNNAELELDTVRR